MIDSRRLNLPMQSTDNLNNSQQIFSKNNLNPTYKIDFNIRQVDHQFRDDQGPQKKVERRSNSNSTKKEQQRQAESSQDGVKSRNSKL